MEDTGQSNTQEFCLRWNNFHASLISALDGFKNDQDFVDVTLACEGQFLKAHKMLLSACSVFFRDLLKANPCQHPIVILPPEVRFGDLEKLLRFIYQGEVNVQQENLARFLKTAEMLKIRGLAEDSEKQRVLRASSPRPPETGESDSFSPKRPRLSIDVQQSSQEPHTPNDDSRLSADSDSEMIPVKQEMVELKECSESLYEGDGDSFIPEAYLREGSNSNSTINNQSSSSSSHPNAPPPPGPLQPSYVPPPQVKTQDDSPLALPPPSDELSQGFDILRAYEYNGGSHSEIGVIGNNIKSTYMEASPFGGVSNALPWRRPLSGTDGYVSCPQCQKPITSYNLNRHIRMVHSNMEHAVCMICNKEFKNKYSLATHIHRQHSDPSNVDHHQEVNSIPDVTQPVCRTSLDIQSVRKVNDNDEVAPHQIKNQPVNYLNHISESSQQTKQIQNTPYSPMKTKSI